jgi:hypothetical protein
VEHQEIRPRAWTYALAAIPLVIGCVVFGVILFFGISGTVDSAQGLSGALTQVVVPGSATLTLDETGAYTIFHEYRSVVNGRVYSNTSMSSMDCTLTSDATGANVPIQLAAFNSTYEFGSRAGQSVMQFDIAEPGAYTFSCRYTSGAAEPQIVLAIGHNFMGDIFGTVFGAIGSVFGAIAVAFGAITVALIIVIVITVRRHRSKQEIEGPAAWRG